MAKKTKKSKEEKKKSLEVLKEGDTCPECKENKLVLTLTCKDDDCGATFNPADGFRIMGSGFLRYRLKKDASKIWRAHFPTLPHPEDFRFEEPVTEKEFKDFLKRRFLITRLPSGTKLSIPQDSGANKKINVVNVRRDEL